MKLMAYSRIGLTAKPNLTAKDEAVRQVYDVLHSTGAQVFIDSPTLSDVGCVRMCEPLTMDSNIDLLVVIGGDGTILRAIREFRAHNVPIVGINRGVLGFLAEVAVDEVHSILPDLLSGGGVLEERHLADVRIERDGGNVFSGFALNEAVVSQGAIARLLDLRTDISGEPLATFHADGLIVATPTGSTAYSLAAGGPVVHPSLAALILTPLNPHSLTQKPVVIPGDRTVHMDILGTNGGRDSDAKANLTLDGQVYVGLEPGDRVSVSLHEHSVRFLRRNGERFFHALRTKLRWSERV